MNTNPRLSDALWQDALQHFAPIGLEEMDAVKLMKRVDTKFMVSMPVVLDWLTSIAPHYRVLDINGVQIQTYNTRYFDTPDFVFYLMHHNGKANRFKVRKRAYFESAISFLEVKKKDQKKVTHKERIPTASKAFDLLPTEEVAFIEKTIGKPLELIPVIDTNFRRITLASEVFQERITIDLDLTFSMTGKEKKPHGVVIIELKQPKFNAHSPAFSELRKLGVRKTRLSKYCIGMAMCKPELKHNAFKAKLRAIEKLKS